MSPTSVRSSITSLRMRLTWPTGTASQSASRAPRASTSTTSSSKRSPPPRPRSGGGRAELSLSSAARGGDRAYRQRHVAEFDVVGTELEPRLVPLAPLLQHRVESGAIRAQHLDRRALRFRYVGGDAHRTDGYRGLR